MHDRNGRPIEVGDVVVVRLRVLFTIEVGNGEDLILLGPTDREDRSFYMKPGRVEVVEAESPEPK